MTTTISIQVGPLTATRSYANDAKAGAALLAFYDTFDLGSSDASNREKLEAVLDWFTGIVRDKAILHYVQTQRAADEATARGTYGFE